MKFADRLKVASTGTSAASLTLGAAAADCRTLAQVIASGEISVNDTNVPFLVTDDANNWESGLYTISSSTAIIRTQILNSSNGGAAVTFSGSALSVYNSVTASTLNAGFTNPHDSGFDIILLIGQSNAVGQDVTTAALDIVDPRIFAYGSYVNESATYRKITQAVDPLRHNYTQPSLPTVGNGAGLGPGSWLARTYVGMIPSNRKVLLVPCARSATKLFADTREWFPGDGSQGSGTALGAAGSTLLDTAIDQATRAVAEAKLLYPNSRFVGSMWLQGEGDADWYGANLQLNYTGALKTLVQAIRARVPGASNSWFVIGGLMAENVADTAGHPGYVAVDNAHRTVAAEFPRCAYTPGLTGYKMGDNLHYTAAGQRIIGCNMAAIIPSAMLSRGVDTTAPVTRSATVYAGTTSTVAVALSEPYDPAYPPQASAWAVTGHTVTAASGNGNYIYLTVSSPFVNGEATRTVAYTAPGSSGLRDLAGNLMGTQGAMNITNNAPVIDSTPPTLSGATVANASPATLTMTASESLDTTNVPATSAFTVSGHTVTSVAVASGAVTLSLGEPFVYGEAARTISYTQPGSAGLRDLAGNLMASFSGVSVTNNVASSDTTAPTFSSAQVANASPSVVQITMSESLAASVPPTSAFTITEGGVTKTVSSVSVSGAIVSVTMSAAFSSGTTIQATYTAPGADPRIKDASGNVTANFGPVTVTNNIVSMSATDLQFPTLASMTDTSTGAPSAPVPPYSYQMGNVNFGATAVGGITTKSLAGDGSVTVKINTITARHMLSLKTGSSLAAYGSLPVVLWAELTGSGGYKGRGTYTAGVTGRAPVNNDYMRLTRTGTTVVGEVSSDGTTWATIATWTGISGTLYCEILSEANGQFIGPVGTGWA